MGLGEAIRPVLQRLPDNGGARYVVVGLALTHTSCNEIALPSTLRATHGLPSSYLTVIVQRSATHIKSAIPLKPPKRILLNDPPRRFPGLQTKGILAIHGFARPHTIAIDGWIINVGRHLAMQECDWSGKGGTPREHVNSASARDIPVKFQTLPWRLAGPPRKLPASQCPCSRTMPPETPPTPARAPFGSLCS